jgi:hypothetical protein
VKLRCVDGLQALVQARSEPGRGHEQAKAEEGISFEAELGGGNMGGRWEVVRLKADCGT